MIAAIDSGSDNLGNCLSNSVMMISTGLHALLNLNAISARRLTIFSDLSPLNFRGQGEYEYIHEFKERINEIVDLQKRDYQIIEDMQLILVYSKHR